VKEKDTRHRPKEEENEGECAKSAPLKQTVQQREKSKASTHLKHTSYSHITYTPTCKTWCNSHSGVIVSTDEKGNIFVDLQRKKISESLLLCW